MGDDPPQRIARRYLIDGRVQGVGFRWHTRLEARSLGLVGWVRNLDDGRVEAHVEGRPESVDGLASWFGRGPSGASVEEIETVDVALEGHRSFRIVREG